MPNNKSYRVNNGEKSTSSSTSPAPRHTPFPLLYESTIMNSSHKSSSPIKSITNNKLYTSNKRPPPSQISSSPSRPPPQTPGSSFIRTPSSSQPTNHLTDTLKVTVTQASHLPLSSYDTIPPSTYVLLHLVEGSDVTQNTPSSPTHTTSSFALHAPTHWRTKKKFKTTDPVYNQDYKVDVSDGEGTPSREYRDPCLQVMVIDNTKSGTEEVREGADQEHKNTPRRWQ